MRQCTGYLSLSSCYQSTGTAELCTGVLLIYSPHSTIWGYFALPKYKHIGYPPSQKFGENTQAEQANDP